MTPDQIIAAVAKEEGTVLEKLTALLRALNVVAVMGEYRPPRCACGAELGVWFGRHTGNTFITHPLAAKCPRAGHRAWAKGADAAMRLYVEKAPDLGALDEHPEAKKEIDLDPDFSSEFQ